MTHARCLGFQSRVHPLGYKHIYNWDPQIVSIFNAHCEMYIQPPIAQPFCKVPRKIIWMWMEMEFSLIGNFHQIFIQNVHQSTPIILVKIVKSIIMDILNDKFWWRQFAQLYCLEIQSNMLGFPSVQFCISNVLQIMPQVSSKKCR